MAEVSAEELASWLNVTRRRVHQMAKDGTIPKRGADGFDLQASVVAYIRFLKTPSEGENGGIGLEKIKLERAQIALDRERMELHRDAGALIAIEDATQYAVSIVEAVRAVLQRMPRKHGVSPEDRARLKKVFAEALAAAIDASTKAVQALAPAPMTEEAAPNEDDDE